MKYTLVWRERERERERGGGRGKEGKRERGKEGKRERGKERETSSYYIKTFNSLTNHTTNERLYVHTGPFHATDRG